MINTWLLQIIRKRRLGNKYDPINLFLETYDYDAWFENKESTDTTRKRDKEESTDRTRKSDKEQSVDLSDMPPLEANEQVKERRGLNILTPNKLLTWFAILLAIVKAGNSSYKLKYLSFVSAW